MKLFVKSLSLIFLIIFIIPLFSYTVNRNDQYLDENKLMHIKESSAPIVYENGILFTYEGDGNNVKLSGSFVQWEKVLDMKKSFFGVWYYFFKKSIPEGNYSYKYNVDNFWILDPLNDAIIRDKKDHPLSKLKLEKNYNFYQESPYIDNNGKYTFWLKSPKASRVYLVGDFNNWNPYQIEMKKVDSFWKVSIDLQPGEYGYKFVIDYTEEILDPNNEMIKINIFNSKCSVVRVPMR